MVPLPDGAPEDFLPGWFTGEVPTLIWPPLAELGAESEEGVQLELSAANFYYGTLRALAETADQEASRLLRELALYWNEHAAREVCSLAQLHFENDLETTLLHYELAMDLDAGLFEAVLNAGVCEFALSTVGDEDREERLEAAGELFRRAIDMNPESGLAWWSMARIHSVTDDEDGARRLLQTFLLEHPQGADRELVEGALTHGFDAVGGPSAEQVAFNEAQEKAFGGDPAGAVALLTPLSEQFPDSGEIWFVLGAAHRRAGDPLEAERCLRRAARLAGTEPFVLFELAQAYVDAQDYTEAEDTIRKALEIDPQNAGFLCLLGRILLEMGDRDGAAEALETAREMVPDDPEVQALIERLGS